MDRYDELKEIDFSGYQQALIKYLRHNYGEDVFIRSVLLSYIFYWMKKHNSNNLNQIYREILNSQMKKRVKDKLLSLLEIINEEVLDLAFSFDMDTIKAYILFSKDPIFSKSNEDTSPDSIISLADKILAPKEGQVVADFCSGLGNYLLYTSLKRGKCDLVGVELNLDNAIVSNIKQRLVDREISTINENLFFYKSYKKFDRIFSDYPFSQKTIDLYNSLKDQTHDYDYLKHNNNNASADWEYNKRIMASLKDDGRALVIMSNAGLWNDADIDYRRTFLRNGWIEAVINLPDRLFASMQKETSLLVLSKDNAKIKFIDARMMYVNMRRKNRLSESLVGNIVDGLKSSDKGFMEINYSDIKYPFILTEGKLRKEKKHTKTISLDSVVLGIRRGAGISSSQLNKLFTEVGGNCKYLQINNLEEGRIKGKLQAININKENFKRFILDESDLVLTKNGLPFKAMVYKDIDYDILVSGNFYIIKIDQDKYNPVFLKEFFESKFGQNVLIGNSKGTNIRTVSIKDLRKLQIPDIDIDQQDDMVKKIKDIELDILQLKDELERKKLEKAALLSDFLND